MERSDSTHIAVGGILLGVGAGVVAISIPLAIAAKDDPWSRPWFLVPTALAGVLALLGVYALVAVYRGWWLPTTAIEREFTPKLVPGEVREETRFETLTDKYLVFVLAFENTGRSDIPRAAVNVVVPEFVKSLTLCSVRGEPTPEPGSYTTTSESLLREGERDIPSIYWNRAIDFPGRTHRILHLRARMDEFRDFPLRCEIAAPELDEVYNERFTLTLTPQAEPLALGQAPEQGGSGS